MSTSPYDAIAALYDPWSRSVTEDVGFYVAEARKAGGPVVELGVGTGRIAVPIAAQGVPVIGVDSSAAMLEAVLCPFRSYLHLPDDRARLEALHAARAVLPPGGHLVFDVFAPKPDDIAETHGRWLEREPGIHERADWDADARTLTLSVRDDSTQATMHLAWISADEWLHLLETAGFEVEASYGWFDRSPYDGGEDMIFLARPRGLTPD
jgi:hypothetical protein